MKNRENLESIFSDYRNKKLFFFAGSGVSYDSNLPSAFKILQNTIDIFLPKNINLSDKELFYEIQPEVFYETILNLANDDLRVLNMWKSLSTQFNQYVKPNINHYFIVKYSYIANIPILTTNFDFMFESVAKRLNIPFRVYLPEEEPPNHIKNRLCICKLHGSIESKEEAYTPSSIFTTMSTITKLNQKWILFIVNLLKQKHITFVGYSGRDIDIFPFIKNNISINNKSYWINRFDLDRYSNKYATEIDSIKIDFFPKTIFKTLLKKTELSFEYREFCFNQNFQNSLLFKELKNDLEKKKIFSELKKKVLFFILLKSMGFYKKAYVYGIDIYSKDLSKLEKDLKIKFLKNFAQLNHEVSKYETYKKISFFVMKYSIKKLDINSSIETMCYIAEAYRMNIVNSLYFKFKKSKKEYLFMIAVFGLFTIVYFFNKVLKILFSKKLKYYVLFEILEHEIRFFSIIQNVFEKNKIVRKVLIFLWDYLKKESYKIGYTAGIANSLKFKQRLMKNSIDEYEDAENIYNLLTSSTGKDLNLKNIADKAFAKGEFKEAKKMFQVLIKQAYKNGNRLNEMKGILALAVINLKLNRTKLLDEKYLKRFDDLSLEIEGVFLKNYFSKVKEIIKKFN